MKTLEKLKKYLSEVTKEEFDEHWNAVKGVGVNNGWLIASESDDIHNVSNRLNIKMEDWDHTCGDGCCYTFGTDIYLNGEQLDEQNGEDSKNALTAVLTKLGYTVEIDEC